MYFILLFFLSSLVPDMRLMQGDELKLRYVGSLRSWDRVGHVTKVPNSSH